MAAPWHFQQLLSKTARTSAKGTGVSAAPMAAAANPQASTKQTLRIPTPSESLWSQYITKPGLGAYLRGGLSICGGLAIRLPQFDAPLHQRVLPVQQADCQSAAG